MRWEKYIPFPSQNYQKEVSMILEHLGRHLNLNESQLHSVNPLLSGPSSSHPNSLMKLQQGTDMVCLFEFQSELVVVDMAPDKKFRLNTLEPSLLHLNVYIK